MTCVPALSDGRRIVVPVPRLPSLLDFHVIVLERSPSSASMAVAARTTGFPERRLAPSPGVWIVTTGGTFGGRMTTVICARPTRPPRSVDDAVMLCVPTERRLVEKVAP